MTGLICPTYQAARSDVPCLTSGPARPVHGVTSGPARSVHGVTSGPARLVQRVTFHCIRCQTVLATRVAAVVSIKTSRAG